MAGSGPAMTETHQPPRTAAHTYRCPHIPLPTWVNGWGAWYQGSDSAPRMAPGVAAAIWSCVAGQAARMNPRAGYSPVPIWPEGGHHTRTRLQSPRGETSITGWSAVTRLWTQFAWVTRICRADTTRDTTATCPLGNRPDRPNTSTLPGSGVRERA